MCLFAWTVVFVSIYTSTCQNPSVSEEFKSLLHDAAADVFAQHSEMFSRPPTFKATEGFMRSFVPGTGVGNREELVVDDILPLPVFEDARFSKFLFKHFNNTDYIVGISNNKTAIYRINASLNEYFVLSSEDVVFTYDSEWALIKDVVLFTRFTKNAEVLYVAIVTENAKTSVLYVYELIGDTGLMAAAIDLKVSSTATSSSVKKISYVQSSYRASLVVLTETANEGLVYKQQGHNVLNHYIELNYPSAVDLVTFGVHGRGYIAVANDAYCEVFKMDQFVGSHKLFDRLGPFSAVKDLEYFRLGFHHYLAIADANGYHLYTWKKGEFAFKQKLAMPNVQRVYAGSVESCRDEVILLTVTGDGGAHLHVFNGQTEKFMTVDAAVPEGYLINAASVTSFTYRDTVVILFVDHYKEHKAFVIKSSLKPLRDYLLVQGEKVSAVMKKIQDTMASQNKEIKRIKEVLKNAVRITGTQSINSVQYFGDISSTNGTEVEKVNEVELEWEGSSLTLEEYRRGTDDLERNVEELERLVEEIERTMPDVVRLDEEAVITGQKVFTGYVSADTLMATSLNLQTVAGMDLPQIQKNVYRLDKPQFIEGTLVFREPLTVTENLHVDETVNGIDISEEVMTTNTEQASDAEMAFMNKLLVGRNLEVSGKVNDIDLSEEVVTLTGTHHILGKKNFLNGIKARTVQTKFLDGVHIDDLYERAFTRSGDQIVTDDSRFSAVTTHNIILNGLLNGYVVQELEKSVVRIDRPSKISGFKTFLNDVTIDGELTVHGTVNGLKIPDDLVLTDRTQTITGTKEFVGRVVANKMYVQGEVDGLRIPEDIVTLSRDEEISSTLYFADGIAAEKDLIVEGLVDLVDISEIAKQAMKLTETNQFNHAVFLGPVTISGDLDARGFVNKVNLSRLLKDIVYRDEKPIEISSKKYFDKVTADRVRLDHSINGFNIEIDFMRIHGHQTINGTKTLKNAVFNSIYVEDGMIDDLNITDLYRHKMEITVDLDSEMEEEIEFVDEVVIEGSLTVLGTIDGLRIPEDVVLRHSNRSISNKLFVEPVVVNHLLIDGDINTEMFGGKNITEFYNDRVTLSGNQQIHGDIWLGDATADKVSIAGLVNGLNIAEFAKNVMSKTKPQTVTATKEFSGNVSVSGDINTREGVNGFNLQDIKRRAFKLLEDNVVTAPLELEDNVTLDDLGVAGGINGVNITRLYVDSLRKSADIQYVQGNTYLHEGFHVAGDIMATKLNGLVLKEDVLLKSIPQTIKGQFTLGSVGVGGDFVVNGLINGLDLSEVAPKLARIDSVETVIESDITFTSFIHVLEDIEVTGTVNEVDLKGLFDKVLRKTGSQTITGHKVFRGNVTIVGDIDVKSINGIDWQEFLDDVVWINAPQEIGSSKTFKDDIIVQKDMFVSGVAHIGTVNGKDLQMFVDNAVFIDRPANITGPIVFKQPIEITGDMNADLINGLQLKTDVITIMCSDDGPQRITGRKTFQKIKVFGDIYTDSVNSYDLLKLYEDTLLTEGNQTVTGWKVVDGDVVFKRNVYPDVVNGMILNRDLVTLHTEQRIQGPLVFRGDVFVEKNMLLNGLLNGVDLYNLSREAVYLDTYQVIEGSYSLHNAIVASNVEVGGTVNGMDLAAFDKNVTEFLQETKSSVAIMERYAQDHCALAKYLQESLENSYYALDSFVIHQEMDFAASFITVSSDRDITLVHLDELATSAVSVQHVWDESTKTFQASHFSSTLVASSFGYQLGSTVVIVNIGINNKDSSIIIENAGYRTTVETGFTDASVMLKTDIAIALLFPSKSVCNVYSVKDHPEKTYSFDFDASLTVDKETKAILMFELSGALYLATSGSFSPYGVKSSKIYAKGAKNWQQVQRITTYGSFMKHFQYQSYHYLAFANNAPVYETKEPKAIQVYRNSGSNGRFVLFQKILFDDARGMEVFQFGDLSQLHLVVWNGTIVQIFGLEGESGLKELFAIHGDCVRDVKPLTIEKDFYLIVGRQNLETEEAVKAVLYKGLTKGIRYDSYSLVYC